jgi:hypothetical protein
MVGGNGMPNFFPQAKQEKRRRPSISLASTRSMSAAAKMSTRALRRLAADGMTFGSDIRTPKECGIDKDAKVVDCPRAVIRLSDVDLRAFDPWRESYPRAPWLSTSPS